MQVLRYQRFCFFAVAEILKYVPSCILARSHKYVRVGEAETALKIRVRDGSPDVNLISSMPNV